MEAQEAEDIYVLMVDSHCCTAETNTIKSKLKKKETFLLLEASYIVFLGD